MKTGKTLIGLLGGVAIGSILGILFAPDKGTNTRKKIAKKSNEATDSLKQQLETLSTSFSEKINSLKSQGEDFLDKKNENINIENMKKMNKGLNN